MAKSKTITVDDTYGIYLLNSLGTVGITPEGGFATKRTAGENLVQGNLVDIDSAGNMIKIVINQPDPIGVAYHSASTNDPVWIVTSGIADVYFVSDVTAGNFARGFITGEGDYVTGQAKAEAVPSSPFSSDKHFYEIGHCLEARTGAGLAKVNLHFN
jgi:hypothetical protein